MEQSHKLHQNVKRSNGVCMHARYTSTTLAVHQKERHKKEKQPREGEAPCSTEPALQMRLHYMIPCWLLMNLMVSLFLSDVCSPHAVLLRVTRTSTVHSASCRRGEEIRASQVKHQKLEPKLYDAVVTSR